MTLTISRHSSTYREQIEAGHCAGEACQSRYHIYPSTVSVQKEFVGSIKSRPEKFKRAN
jgi:hypothetical protein